MSIKTWQKRLASYDAGQPIPKSIIIAACSALRSLDTPEAVKEALYQPMGYGITPQQTEQGLAWLRRKSVLKQLRPAHLAVLDTFERFELVELRETTRHGWVPVYRVIGAAGSFDYCMPTFGVIEVLK